MAFRTGGDSKRGALWKRKAEEMAAGSGFGFGFGSASGSGVWDAPLGRGHASLAFGSAARPSSAATAPGDHFRAASMRAAALQRAVDRDWLPGERGPRMTAAGAAMAGGGGGGGERNFLVCTLLTPDTRPDALIACLASLLRARLENGGGHGGRGGPAGGAQVRVTVYHAHDADLEPYEDAWHLPWADADVALRFRAAVAAEPPAALADDPRACRALFRLRAMNAAVGAAEQLHAHLLWISPGVIFGADPFGELLRYVPDVAVLGHHEGARKYSTAALFVAQQALVRARGLLTAMRSGLVHDAGLGTLRNAAPGCASCEALADHYLTRAAEARSGPPSAAAGFAVLARTRFLPQTSPAHVVFTRVPLGMTNPSGSPAQEFLAAVDALAQSDQH
jgi:hypothetical protein